jgi:acetyl-CoA acetyltransferase
LLAASGRIAVGGGDVVVAGGFENAGDLPQRFLPEFEIAGLA